MKFRSLLSFSKKTKSTNQIAKSENIENPHRPLWQYRLWSFQTRGTKLERVLPKNQHTQRKLLNFENWINGKLSKIGHHFSNKAI